MTSDTYPGHIFADAYNKHFQKKAVWYMQPKELTDTAAQESVLAHWNYEKDYSEQVRNAAEKYRAAKILDHDVERYRKILTDSIKAYKTFIDNLSLNDYDFSSVTSWPYRPYERLLND